MGRDQLPPDPATLTSLTQWTVLLIFGLKDQDPAPLDLLLLEYLITAAGQETKAATFGSAAVRMPSHGKT